MAISLISPRNWLVLVKGWRCCRMEQLSTRIPCPQKPPFYDTRSYMMKTAVMGYPDTCQNWVISLQRYPCLLLWARPANQHATSTSGPYWAQALGDWSPIWLCWPSSGSGSPWAVWLQASLSNKLVKDILVLYVSVVDPRTLSTAWRTSGPC